MRITLVRVLTAVAFLFAFGLVNQASACICGDGAKTPCLAYSSADAVFTGMVLSVVALPRQPADHLSLVAVRFQVDQAFKGISEKEVEVRTVSGTECDLDFKDGRQYFVYGYRDAKTGLLGTHLCSGTTELRYAADKLAFARAAGSSLTPTRVMGRANRLVAQPESLEIRISGPAGELRVAPDTEGWFEVNVGKAGTYTVTIICPTDCELYATDGTWTITSVDGKPAATSERKVRAGECNYIDLWSLANIGPARRSKT